MTAAVAEFVKEAPPEMADDLLVLAGVSSGDISVERASAHIPAAC